jgi:hypothetical protein
VNFNGESPALWPVSQPCKVSPRISITVNYFPQWRPRKVAMNRKLIAQEEGRASADDVIRGFGIFAKEARALWALRAAKQFNFSSPFSIKI